MMNEVELVKGERYLYSVIALDLDIWDIGKYIGDGIVISHAGGMAVSL